MRRVFKGILALIFLAFVGSVIVNPKAPHTDYYAGSPTPLIIAHQGVDGIITDRPDLLIEILGR